MDGSDVGPDNAAITRRKALRYGGVVAGGIWVAPVVTSLTSPAYATGSPAPTTTTSCGCTHLVHLTRNSDDTYSCSTGSYICDFSPTRYGAACTSGSCAQIVSAVWSPGAWSVQVTFACTPKNVQHAQDCSGSCQYGGLRPTTDPRTFEVPSTCQPASTAPDEVDLVFECNCPA